MSIRTPANCHGSRVSRKTPEPLPAPKQTLRYLLSTYLKKTFIIISFFQYSNIFAGHLPRGKQSLTLQTVEIQLLWSMDHPTPPFFGRQMASYRWYYDNECVRKAAWCQATCEASWQADMVCLLTTRLFLQLPWAVDHPTPPFSGRQMASYRWYYDNECEKEVAWCQATCEASWQADMVCLLTTRLFLQLPWSLDHPTPPFFGRQSAPTST